MGTKTQKNLCKLASVKQNQHHPTRPACVRVSVSVCACLYVNVLERLTDDIHKRHFNYLHAPTPATMPHHPSTPLKIFSPLDTP